MINALLNVLLDRLSTIASFSTLLPLSVFLLPQKALPHGHYLLKVYFVSAFICNILLTYTAALGVRNLFFFNIYQFSELFLISAWFYGLLKKRLFIFFVTAIIAVTWIIEVARIGLNTSSNLFAFAHTLYLCILCALFIKQAVSQHRAEYLPKEFFIAVIFFLYYSNDILANIGVDTFYKNELKNVANLLVDIESFFYLLQNIFLAILFWKWTREK